jgi:glycosyltransferase involved in cell wall biosynthesis
LTVSTQEKPGIAIFRSNPISPNPRVEKAASVAAQVARVTVVGWDRTGLLPERQYRQGYTLELFSLKAPFGSGLGNLPRLLRWEWFLVLWVLRHGRHYSVFHACDFDTIFPALLGRWFFKIRVIYDICDFYADHIRNTPTWILKFVRFLDRLAVRWADAVILVDEARTVQLGDARPKRLEFIYNAPVDFGEITQSKNLSKSLRLAYIGTLQVERGLLELCAVLARHPDWTLDLAGFGGDEGVILEKALPVPGITWHGRVDYSKTLDLSRSADVLIATYDPSIPNHRLSSPNKVFEAMMLGKPIIVAGGTHVDEIIDKWQCGLVVQYGSQDDLEKALITLSGNAALRKTLGDNARRAYDQEYSWSIMQARLVTLYSKLIPHGRAEPDAKNSQGKE